MLRLATDQPTHDSHSPHNGGPYRIDRRRAVRRAEAGRALAVRRADSRISGGGGVFLGQLMPLELKDISRSGLAAVCEDKLPLHEPITIYMSGERRRPGAALHGQVVRCRSLPRRSHGRGCYQIAIAFDPNDAA